MSDVKINGAGPAATPTPVDGQSKGTGGALGLGIDIGVVVDPSAGTAYETPAYEVDTYDSSQRPADNDDRADRDDATARSGRNPFDQLRRARAEVKPRRLAQEGLGMDTELDPSFESLGKLAQMQGKLGADEAEAFAKLNKGMTMLTGDGQDARGGKLKLDGGKLETLAQKMLAHSGQYANEHFEAFAKMHARFLAGGKGNIQAFVQRVLRESYLIQNQLLFDYAAKVRHYNDLKKLTREKLMKAREAKTAWRSQKDALSEGERFLADPSFPWEELDNDNGTWHGVPMTEDDVASWEAVNEAAAKAMSGGAGDDYDAVYGKSFLTADDKDVLETMKEKKGFWGTGTDNYIRDHMSDLLPLISKMNQDDLKKYLAPIIEILSGGNADEKELLEIFGYLTPTQFLYTVAGDIDPEHYASLFEVDGKGIAGAAAGAYAGALAGGVAGGLGVLVGAVAGGIGATFLAGGPFNDEEKAELGLLARKAGRKVAEAAGVEFSGELTPEKAARLLGALHARRKAQDDGVKSANRAVPATGSPKQIRTIEQMETYIEELESNLNSIGDDAQLANVDLQNALQKQQHTLQMLSNMAKMLHDTAMSIVRRMGS
ncbi:MAG: hypothetical protein V3T05_01520 [Myxococcota bacterium]